MNTMNKDMVQFVHVYELPETPLGVSLVKVGDTAKKTSLKHFKNYPGGF